MASSSTKTRPYFELSDLKGKLVSVPFGSAAHGMVLKAMQDRGWPADYFQLVSQSPEVGSTNLQEKKIDAHADFVPFAELLPFRGFARKIFDGVETNLPTWHGVVVRTDFAEKYPEVVVAYIKALIEANAWFRADPKTASEKIQEWTGINKEVVYIFLGPGGNMTTDPTIKPALIDAAAQDVKVLQNLGRMKEFDVTKWVDDSYIRKAYAELKLDYDAELKSIENYEVKGEDKFCKKPIADPRKAGEVWVDGEGIEPFSSAACTLGAYAVDQGQGQEDQHGLRVRHRPRHQAVRRPGLLCGRQRQDRDRALPAQEGRRGVRVEERRQGAELRRRAESGDQRRLTRGTRRSQIVRNGCQPCGQPGRYRSGAVGRARSRPLPASPTDRSRDLRQALAAAAHRASLRALRSARCRSRCFCSPGTCSPNTGSMCTSASSTCPRPRWCSTA